MSVKSFVTVIKDPADLKNFMSQIKTLEEDNLLDVCYALKPTKDIYTLNGLVRHYIYICWWTEGWPDQWEALAEKHCTLMLEEVVDSHPNWQKFVEDRSQSSIWAQNEFEEIEWETALTTEELTDAIQRYLVKNAAFPNKDSGSALEYTGIPISWGELEDKLQKGEYLCSSCDCGNPITAQNLTDLQKPFLEFLAEQLA